MNPMPDRSLTAAQAHHGDGQRSPAGRADCRETSSAFTPPAIKISAERMLRVMGYRKSASVKARVRETAEAMATLAATAAMPAVHYRRVGIAECTREGLVLATGTRFHGPVFSVQLSDCVEVAIFVLSLGSRFDSTQKELAESERTLEAYMLEIAGWLGIEEATKLFRTHLEMDAARDGLALTRRLAPGYTFRMEGSKVEWPLEDQPAFFSLFDRAALPAQLIEESCAMTPKMSRTGLYGLCSTRAPATGAGTVAMVPKKNFQEMTQDE